MFYCEACRLGYGWPYSVMRWRGLCEVCCRYSADCNDIPSNLLAPVDDSPHDIQEKPGG